MSTPQHLVVIGGVAAGMSAAAKARRVNPALAITVLEQGAWISYSACGLPYLVGGLIESEQKLVARTAAEFAKQHIDVRLHHAATAINVAARTVTVVSRAEASGQPFDLPYDALLLATGARPVRPKIDGLDLDGVFNLYTMGDALRLRAYIAHAQPKRAVVVGGGYIGLEMVENLAQLGLDIALVQRPPQLFSAVDGEIAELIDQELARHNVDVSLCSSILSACSGAGGRVEQVETSGGALDADLVLLATGVQPNVELARAAGVTIGATGAIAVDDHQRTNLAGIYTAGDCAEHFHRITGTPFWVPLGTTANKQGRVAGVNIGGGDATFAGIVGTSITRVFDLAVGRTGLSAKEAHKLGYDALAAVVDFTDIAGYYPDAAPLRVKLVAERGSGRLLGAQAAGRGADKRIDVAATALHAGLTVAQLTELDLGYAPPFNSVWDPLHVAASNLLKELGE